MARRSWHLLVGILVVYAVIIGVDDAAAGGPFRLLVLGYVLDTVLHRHLAVWVGVGVVLAAAIASTILAPAPVTSGLVGAASFMLTALVAAVIARRQLGAPTVTGVLAIYLLLALLFASLNQFLAAFNPDHYLRGVAGLPTASDHLYFSVITLATVGFGDIAPASEPARAVTVVEALTGQLYLVSVVAAVVGRRR